MAKKSVAYTLFFPFYERNLYRIYRADLNRIRHLEAESPTGFEFALLRPDDDRYIRQIESQAEWLAGRLKAKLEGNGACLAALHGDQVAGFNLIAFGEVFIPLVRLKRRFRAGEAWSEHLAVRNEFRRQGIASALRHRIFEQLREIGVKKLYGGTLRSNEPALDLARKLGFVDVADVAYSRVFNRRKWQYHRVGRLVLPCAISFSSANDTAWRKRTFLTGSIPSVHGASSLGNPGSMEKHLKPR